MQAVSKDIQENIFLAIRRKLKIQECQALLYAHQISTLPNFHLVQRG